LLHSPITALVAKNSTLYGRSIGEDHFRGLMNVVYVAVNVNINLTTNTWKKHGLVNGASGTIKHIIYPSIITDNCLPESIIIHFPDYDGPQFFNESERKN